jgi:hypothetical protein
MAGATLTATASGFRQHSHPADQGIYLHKGGYFRFIVCKRICVQLCCFMLRAPRYPMTNEMIGRSYRLFKLGATFVSTSR